MDKIIAFLSPNLPENFDLASTLRFLLFVTAGSLLLSVVGRVFFGKRSSLNHSVSSAIGILFVYCVTVLIYTFNPGGMSRFLSPLPFVEFQGEYLHVFRFTGADYKDICIQVVNLLILAFLVNVLDTWMPKGKKVFGWYCYRFLTILIATVLQILVYDLFNAFLPGVIVQYAPMILLGVLAFMLLLGLANLILSVLLTIVNPILGGIYAFFFSSLVGKMITKAAVTTAILCGVVFALEKLGFTVICIASGALLAYIPLLIVFLILWYVLGHLL